MLQIQQLLNAHHQCLQWIRIVEEEKVQGKGEECPRSGGGMERDNGRVGQRRGGLQGKQRPIKAETEALGQDRFCTSHELKSTCQTIID